MTRYRCHTCGAEFTAWAAAQRHADSHGGARLELVLDPKGGLMPRSSNRKLRRDGERRLPRPRPATATAATPPAPTPQRTGRDRQS